MLASVGTRFDLRQCDWTNRATPLRLRHLYGAWCPCGGHLTASATDATLGPRRDLIRWCKQRGLNARHFPGPI